MLSDKEKDYLIQTYPPIMDFQDMMNALRVSPRTVWRMIEDKTIPVWKDEETGDWQWARADLITWLEKQ